ncbi:M23 family metallopeptidase [Asticcacaulis sp. AC466]|uniref:M23 family metallopeptidase n=1 Tax=Asticcacaulis sp. AC466 TaxID=1282362 RepID=UPI0004CFBC2C|nr:M23 family metallopeptidase [Asticcacaulis sp. AC466]
MAQLDPRRQPVRLTPMVFALATAVTVGTLLWRVIQPMPGLSAPMDPAAAMALETQAYAEAAARPGYSQPVDMPVSVRSGESLTDALKRMGISADEAQMAVNTLSQSFKVTDLKTGLNLEAAIARPVNGTGTARLLGLTLRTGPAKQLTLTTDRDGTMRLRALEESVRDERRIAIGQIKGSLFTSAAALGATPTLTTQVVKLFAHKIDFERDIQAGDSFKLVFDRKVTESGRTVEAGNLLYAEIQAKGGVNRFYSFAPRGTKNTEYYDENGRSIKGFLLATPIYGARTSSGFGMRFHPIVGFMKMHTGIDFAAPSGTPIQAAGDGVVMDAKWWGGYGRWVRIAHNKEWETGYGHMSSIAVRPGQHVTQGQIIGYVGTTGRSTGPHLHFEVWHDHHPIDPKGAKVPQSNTLAGADLLAFRARKREIDSMIAVAQVSPNGTTINDNAVALNGGYHYESENETSRPQALAQTEVSPVRGNARPLRSAITTTRGTR